MMKKLSCFLFLLLPLVSFAQVPVSLTPVPHIQFLSNAGSPLASGCVFTYQAGTTNPATTYVDSTGTATNTNPIILNAGGFADIWIPNAAFKFKIVSTGGVNCASGVTQWTVDNITGVLGLLNLANTWTAANTFSLPVTITPNSNQLVIGTGGNQTTLNFPAPAGNIVINAPSTADTLVGRATTDTLLNKTLTSPALTTPTLTTPIINGAATGTGVQGTDSKVLTSGVNSGVVGALLCDDAQAGATTTGCASAFTPIAAAINLTAQGANISSTPIITPGANGFYRFSCYVVVTQAATVSSSSPSCNVFYTDADSTVSETQQLTTSSGANTVGAIVGPVGIASFYAKSGISISYSTSGYATSGATSMQYAIHIRLEGPL